jgi:hypothetical protein
MIRSGESVVESMHALLFSEFDGAAQLPSMLGGGSWGARIWIESEGVFESDAGTPPRF